MSQQFSPDISRDLIVLPLVKFSWATDPLGSTTNSWVHRHGNFSLVFESSRTMKVMEGADVLDMVDIRQKVQECHAAIQSTKHVNIALHTSQLPTSVLYRRQPPAIAVRYPLSDTEVRRLQLRFSSEDDIETALTFLDGIGCPISAPASSDGKDGQASSRPSSAMPGPSPALPALQPRPSSAMPTLQARPSSAIPALEPRPGFARPPSNDAGLAHAGQGPSTPASFPPPVQGEMNPPPSRGYGSLQYSNRDELLSSSSLYSDQMILASSPSAHQNNQMHDTAEGHRPIQPHSPEGAIEPNPRLDHRSEHAVYEKHLQTESNTLSSQLRRTMTAPYSAPSQSYLNPRPMTPLPTMQQDVEPFRSVPARVTFPHFARYGEIGLSSPMQDRPATAPVTTAPLAQDPLVAMIPPLRELPFNRPQTADTQVSKGLELSSSRPSSASVTQLPPLPTPTFISDEMKGPSHTASAVKSTKNRAPPKKSSRSATGGSTQSKKGRSTPRRAKTSTKSKAATVTKVASGTTATIEDLQLPGPSTDSAQRGQLSSSDTNAADSPREKSTSTAEHPSSASRTAGESTITSDSLRLENLSLAAYAAQSYEDRMQSLEGTIMHLLEDDDFATFCEDVSSCWRRIGLERRGI
ncbi:hypothetical protein K402DRAFT_466994 [Aulographum hederae CBS 113979]|uniref:Uncharacterized protein n=1 Tax=Aulographum hederae CBS 113979 TaxID=1176131 RepID=A0A6G1GMB0_9PEZI|nr:hypothetical protein K402DRAFT_466994 [Aulographum hederae CBS 113979]